MSLGFLIRATASRAYRKHIEEFDNDLSVLEAKDEVDHTVLKGLQESKCSLYDEYLKHGHIIVE